MIQKLPTLEEAIEHWTANRREEARRILEQVVATQPRNEQAWLWLARAAESHSRQQEAISQVLLLNPGNSIAQRVARERFPDLLNRQEHVQNLLIQAQSAAHWERSEELFQQVLVVDPLNSVALDALLAAYARQGQWVDGYRLLNKLRSQERDAAVLVDKQIKFLLKSGEVDLLLSLDEVLLKHPAVKVDHLLKVAEVFAQHKRYPVVAAILERAAYLAPDNQTVLYGLARAYEITGRKKEVKDILKQIADMDRRSKAGQSVMNRLLEEDPYVPLSMRENTVVAVREALGLVIPLILLAFLDNELNFGNPAALVGIIAGFAGAYALVSATSSHEQAIFKPLFPNGVDMPSRYLLGGVGSVLLMLAVYLTMATSFKEVGHEEVWREKSCANFMVYLVEEVPQEDPEFIPPDFSRYPGTPCQKLRSWYDELVMSVNNGSTVQLHSVQR